MKIKHNCSTKHAILFENILRTVKNELITNLDVTGADNSHELVISILTNIIRLKQRRRYHIVLTETSYKPGSWSRNIPRIFYKPHSTEWCPKNPGTMIFYIYICSCRFHIHSSILKLGERYTHVAIRENNICVLLPRQETINKSNEIPTKSITLPKLLYLEHTKPRSINIGSLDHQSSCSNVHCHQRFFMRSIIPTRTCTRTHINLDVLIELIQGGFPVVDT